MIEGIANMNDSYHPRNSDHPRHRATRGFTLIELMVVMLIVSILAAIAIPSYTYEVRKSRRTDAKTALLDIAGREERYFNTANAYTTSQANLGYGTSTAAMTNFVVGNGYYQVTVYSPATAFNAHGPAAPSYEIIATPYTAQQQKDSMCMLFTVDSTGKQTANTATDGSGTDETANCW